MNIYLSLNFTVSIDVAKCAIKKSKCKMPICLGGYSRISKIVEFKTLWTIGFFDRILEFLTNKKLKIWILLNK